MIDLAQTIIAQYANSPIMMALLNNMNTYLDPGADLNNFYNLVWNVNTAQGYGLDLWGRIVGVSRLLNVPSGGAPSFGFSQGTGTLPFDQAPFYTSSPLTQNFSLPDASFRTLILVKALANISGCSTQAINQLLTNLYGAKGRSYVLDLGGMSMSYVFEFPLSQTDLTMLLQSGALQRPAGVGATVISVDAPHTFGFRGSGLQPFSQGILFNGVSYHF